jgi:hypothetical protein
LVVQACLDHDGLHLETALRQPTKTACATGMADVEFGDLGNGGNCLDIGVVQAMPGVDLQAELDARQYGRRMRSSSSCSCSLVASA